jgi:hypothetical protein
MDQPAEVSCRIRDGIKDEIKPETLDKRNGYCAWSGVHMNGDQRV